MEDKIELTEDDFIFFKNCCEYWINRFGLKDWNFIFTFKKTNDDYFAVTTPDAISRTSNINLETAWEDICLDDLSGDLERTLKHVALHEVIHNLVAPLLFVATNRRDDETLINAEEHALIMRLCTTLLEDERVKNEN
jgi:hypothetical protein